MLFTSTLVSILYSADNLVSWFQVLWGHITVGLAYTTGGESGKINKKQEASAAVILVTVNRLSLNALGETIDLMEAQIACENWPSTDLGPWFGQMGGSRTLTK